MVVSVRDSGVTVVELLIVLLALAIVSIAVLAMRDGGSAHRDAAALVRALTSARWLAIVTGEPIALVPNGDSLHLDSGAPLHCNRSPAGAPVWVPSRPGVWRWPGMGLAFAPDGRPRRCDGSAVGNTTILIEGPRGDRAAVIVASLGRVRWERR